MKWSAELGKTRPCFTTDLIDTTLWISIFWLPKDAVLCYTLEKHGLCSLTGKGPKEGCNIKGRPRRFVNSSSTLKCLPLLLNRNAFDLKLEAAVFSDDNEYYMETALRCNPASCPLRWCSICQQEPRPQAGLQKKKKRLQDFHKISTANGLTSLSDSCCHLIEFCNSSFILVYCWHNRWQAGETSPKN